MKNSNALVIVKRNRVITTSLIIAETFGKQHKDILKTIKNLEIPNEFGRRNFALSSYKNLQNKEQPMYEITRDGFTILVMGFTGKKAMQFKIEYITAFNLMENWIANKIWLQSDPERQAAREDGKIYRRSETDTIRDFITYCESQGSKNAGKYYMNLTRMVNTEMFVVPDNFPKPKNLRDVLSKTQLLQLSTADIAVENALKEGMSRGFFYKDIFKLAKERIINFVAAIGGRTEIMSSPQLGFMEPEKKLPEPKKAQLELL